MDVAVNVVALRVPLSLLLQFPLSLLLSFSLPFPQLWSLPLGRVQGCRSEEAPKNRGHLYGSTRQFPIPWLLPFPLR